MLRMCFITFCPLNFIIFRPIGSFRLLPKTRRNVKGKKAFEYFRQFIVEWEKERNHHKQSPCLVIVWEFNQYISPSHRFPIWFLL